jgi:hypothetical protein
MKCALPSGSGKYATASEMRIPPATASRGLRASSPHDAFEQEADRVAHSVTAGQNKTDWSLSKVQIGATLQRKCSCGGPGGAEGECEECKKKETLQRRADGSGTPSFIPAIVEEVLGSPGQPLDAGARAYFEPR